MTMNIFVKEIKIRLSVFKNNRSSLIDSDGNNKNDELMITISSAMIFFCEIKKYMSPRFKILNEKFKSCFIKIECK